MSCTGRAAGPTPRKARSAMPRCMSRIAPGKLRNSSKARALSARTSFGAELWTPPSTLIDSVLAIPVSHPSSPPIESLRLTLGADYSFTASLLRSLQEQKRPARRAPLPPGTRTDPLLGRSARCWSCRNPARSISDLLFDEGHNGCDVPPRLLLPGEGAVGTELLGGRKSSHWRRNAHPRRRVHCPRCPPLPYSSPCGLRSERRCPTVRKRGAYTTTAVAKSDRRATTSAERST